MSRALPQELKTQKVNSLPEDLKSVAEELIGEKFGFEEEVVTKSDSSSRRPADGCSDVFCEVCYNGDVPPRHDPRFMDSPAYGIRTIRITLESCYEIFRQLERKVGPSISRRNVEWRMGHRQFDDLIRDRRSDSAIRLGETPKLFGIPVLLSGVDTYEIELRCF